MYPGPRPPSFANSETQVDRFELIGRTWRAGEVIQKRGFGGPGRDRTDDLFHAMEARSQLRHRPTRGDGQSVNFRAGWRVRQLTLVHRRAPSHSLGRAPDHIGNGFGTAKAVP